MLQANDVAGAEGSATEALHLGNVLGRPGLVATGLLAAGRAAAAAGDDAARAHLEDAIRVLSAVDRPVLRAEVRLELAEVLSAADADGAIAQAQAALPVFARLGIRRETDRTTALLRRLGAGTRVTGQGGQGPVDLSRREREVLALLGQGLSNAEIAGRLFITTRTAEHHVATVLAKLGMRRRAEAAAYAVAQGIR
ncbi:MAG: hypothetical protein E6J14_07235 [Chloroflexi bacterium]|nr:MAG: hypothetical protein E6J14_07235 [Chloroflexota bacterium]